MTESGIYLAYAKCGCLVVIISDDSDDPKWTGREVGRCIKDGYRIERVSVEAYRTMPLSFGCKCQRAPKPEAQQGLFA